MNIFEMILAFAVVGALLEIVPKSIKTWRRPSKLEERMTSVERTQKELDKLITQFELQMQDYEAVRMAVATNEKRLLGQLPAWYIKGRKKK